MSTERDELTHIIASNRNEYADKTADRILAAGYSKPHAAKQMRAALEAAAPYIATDAWGSSAASGLTE